MLEVVRVADGRPIRVARSFELHAADLVLRALAGAQMQSPFRKDDAALAVDAALLECGSLRPILENQQGAIEDARHIGRHPQRVLRVVEVRLGVRVRTDTQAERRQEVDDALLRKVLGALELHVFHEVRQPTLVVVFQHRAGLDHQPKLGAAGGLSVRADVVFQAVRQRADEGFGIHGHLLRESVGGDGRRGRFAPGRSGLSRRDQTKGSKRGGERGDAEAEERHMCILAERAACVNYKLYALRPRPSPTPERDTRDSRARNSLK